MSLNVQTAEVSDITNKWDLAKFTVDYVGISRKSLKPIFKEAIKEFEKISGINFEKSIKRKVWNTVSKERLNIIQETFLLDFCDHVLAHLDEKQAKKLLEELENELKNTGTLKNFPDSQIQAAYAQNRTSIFEAIAKKTNSITSAWLPEIAEVLTKEGIKLPKDYKQKLEQELRLNQAKIRGVN
jgi:hypothetical protein